MLQPLFIVESAAFDGLTRVMACAMPAVAAGSWPLPSRVGKACPGDADDADGTIGMRRQIHFQPWHLSTTRLPFHEPSALHACFFL